MLGTTSPSTTLYSFDNDESGISAYSIGSDGILSIVNGSPFTFPKPVGSYSAWMAINPNGSAVYAENGTTYDFQIDSTTGALTLMPGGFSSIGGTQVVIDPRGQFLYVADWYTGLFDSSGDQLAGISGFKIDASSGNLEPLTNSPFTVPASVTQPEQIVMDPKGQFVYAPFYSSLATGNIAGFTRNPTTGELTAMAGSPFASEPTESHSMETGWLSMHPSGKFLYAFNYTDGSVSAFLIDPSSGALSQIEGSPFPGQYSRTKTVNPAPIATAGPMAADPSGAYLYVLCHDWEIAIYSVNQTTGALSPVSGSPELISGPVIAVAVIQAP